MPLYPVSIIKKRKEASQLSSLFSYVKTKAEQKRQ